MADPKYVKDFIDQMTPYAVAVGDQYGIDPITIITQAAVETGWGREVAGNNYFGVKSHGQPGGQNITTHEEVNGKRVKVRDNFRTYNNLGESVADYGRFLSENPRYAEALKETGLAELSGIATAGYASDSKYHNLTSNVAGMVRRNIRPLPPGSLPEVGTLTDTVPPAAATPVTPSPDLAQMRRTNMPSRLLPDTFASLPKPRQSRAADMGLLEKTAATPYLKRNGDVLDPAGTVFGKEMVTQLPGSRAVQQSQIERNLTAAPPALPRARPLHAAPDMISTSMQRAYHTNPVRLPPLPPSTIGQGPSTRVVQSVPMPAVSAPPPRVTVSTPSTVPQRMAAQDTGNVPRALPSPAARTAFVPEPRYIEPRNVAPAQQQYLGPFTPQVRVAQPNGSIIPNKPEDRLPTGVANNGLDSFGSVAGVVAAPTPAPRLARIPTPAPPYRAVATDLDVRPMPPMPRPRPDLGMGGVDIPGPIAQPGQVAPMPAPRFQRPGMFGRPQIAGHDIPLPGIFGVLQGATMAMNNASGPFNNGADNAMYNGLRGGDFNARGAATAHSGGFMYAPKLGGGYVNVGRQFPVISGAQTYDSLNRRNEAADDAAARVNGGSTRGGSGVSSLSGGSGGGRNRFI